MIDKLKYEEIRKISSELEQQAGVISKLIEGREDVLELKDFVSTVEGYSKFLNNTVDINQDADNAIRELKEHLKK